MARIPYRTLISTQSTTGVVGWLPALRKGAARVRAAHLFKSRFFEPGVVIVSVVILLAAKGADGKGQVPFFNAFVGKYIEETSSSILSLAERPDSVPVLDANALAAVGSGMTGRGGSITAPTPSNLATVHDSALLAIAPTSEDYIVAGGFQRSQVIEYTVQEGDALSFIASDYGVSTNSIIWANNLKNIDAIRPGQVLKIPPVSGIVHTVARGDTIASLAKKYSADESRILAFNDIPADGALNIGDELVIPDGKMPQSATTISGSAYTIASSIATEKKFSYLPNLGSYFMQPTSGYNWGILHGRNGVDVANSCGTPIYAAADGTITTALTSGWNGGFGKYIKIAHANGTETLYAHLSQLKVSIGAAVSRGQLIALMGTTGNSTGCHLHFEVHGARNPLVSY